jgi:hypothetical protein
MKPMAHALNDWLAVRLISLGLLDDLKGEGHRLYDPKAEAKALIRVIDTNRIEVAEHVIPLEEELNFVLQALKLGPEKGLKFVENETKSHMSNAVVDRIANYRADYLAIFEKYMTPEQKQRIQPALDNLHYLIGLFDAPVLPQEFWERAPTLMASKDRDIRELTLHLLAHQPQWPKKFWEQAPSFMTSKNPNVVSVISTALKMQPALPTEFKNQLPSFMASKDPHVQVAAANLLENQSEWTNEVWDHALRLMKSGNPKVQTAIIYALERQPEWTKEASDQMRALKGSKDHGVQAAVLSALQDRKLSKTGRCLNAYLVHSLQ